MNLTLCIFITLNIPLGLMGMALFAIGTMLGLFDSVMKPVVQPQLQSLPVPADTTTSIGGYLTGPSVAFTCVGAVFCVCSVMTCMAFCGKAKPTSICFILIYDFVIGILLILVIALIAIVANAETTIGGVLSTYLFTTLSTGYVSVDSMEPTNLLWNIAQIGLQCCGIHGGSDYDLAVAFNRTWLAMQDPTDYTKTLKLVIPPSCCTTTFLSTASSNYTASNPSASSSTAMKSAQLMSDCVFYYKDAASNYKYGCMPAFWVRFNQYVWYILGPAIAIFLFLLFLFVVPIVVICQNRKAMAKNNNDKVDNNDIVIEKNNKDGRDSSSMKEKKNWRSGTVSAGKQTEECEDSDDDDDEEKGDKALRGGHLY